MRVLNKRLLPEQGARNDILTPRLPGSADDQPLIIPMLLEDTARHDHLSFKSLTAIGVGEGEDPVRRARRIGKRRVGDGRTRGVGRRLIGSDGWRRRTSRGPREIHGDGNGRPGAGRGRVTTDARRPARRRGRGPGRRGSR